MTSVPTTGSCPPRPLKHQINQPMKRTLQPRRGVSELTALGAELLGR